MAIQKLRRGFSVFSSFTLLSRILGVGRDIGFAYILGAGSQLDIFLLAFRLPNTLRRFVGDGALNQALVPEFAGAAESARNSGDSSHPDGSHPDGSHLDGASQLLATLHWRYLGVLCGVAALVWLFAAWIVRAFAPGFSAAAVTEAASLLRIMVPYIVLLGYNAIWLAAFNFRQKFHYGAILPIFLNCAFLGAIGLISIGGYGASPRVCLAWAVVIAAVGQLGWVMWAWVRSYGWPGISRECDARVMRAIWRRMIAGWFGSSVVQLSILLDTVIASLLGAGSISWLYFADRLNNLPLGVFGVALATVMLPVFSGYVAQKRQDKLEQSLLWALESWGWWILPATVGIWALAGPLVGVLFGYGSFDGHDIRMTAAALRGFSLGLPAAVLVKILVAWYNAHSELRYPVRSAWICLTISVPVTIGLGYAFGHVGLAYANSFSAYLNCGLLLYFARIFRLEFGLREVWQRVRVQLVASLLMGLGLYLLRFQVVSLVGGGGHWLALGKLLAVIGLGAASYWLVTYCLGASIVSWWHSRDWVEEG